MAGSLSHFKMILVWPIHARSSQTSLVTWPSSSTPFAGTVWTKVSLVLVHLMIMFLTILPSARASMKPSSSVTPTSSMASAFLWRTPFAVLKK